MIFPRALALIAALCLGAYAPAGMADADTDWQYGQDAFAAGDIASAQVYFENARDKGLQGPAVHYNLAVCYYELGDYEAARSSFKYIALQFPAMRGLAEYNVGLAEQRLGNQVAAQRQFISAYRHSDDATVKALAASQLQDLMRAAPTDWYGSVSMQFGYDDNIALRDSLGLPAGESGESPMADLFATTRIALPGNTGLAADASLYAITYTDADDYDQVEARLGMAHRWQPDSWRVDSGIYLTAGTLGGSRFNEELNADVRATRYLSDEASFEIRMRYDDIRGAQAQFSGLDGNRARVDLRYRWYRVPHYLSVRVGFENNDRVDAGVSPSRQRVAASYYYQLNDQWELEASLSFRASDFDDLDVPRSEDLQSVTLGTSFRLSDDWIIAGRFQYSNNDSSDPVFAYDRRQFTIGLQRLF